MTSVAETLREAGDVDIITMTELARNTRKVCEKVRYDRHDIVVQHYGEPRVALIGYDDYVDYMRMKGKLDA